MNFMYGDVHVKESLTKEGLADVVHKLWAWVALNKTVSTSALKLLATFTTKCNVGKMIFHNSIFDINILFKLIAF